MKAKLENINGVDYLTFKVNGEIGITQLPVITKGNREGTNAWTWNGDLEKPTLKPSVRTCYPDKNGDMTEIHYWLNGGAAHCLNDCKDGNAGKTLELVDIRPKPLKWLLKNKLNINKGESYIEPKFSLRQCASFIDEYIKKHY